MFLTVEPAQSQSDQSAICAAPPRFGSDVDLTDDSQSSATEYAAPPRLGSEADLRSSAASNNSVSHSSEYARVPEFNEEQKKKLSQRSAKLPQIAVENSSGSPVAVVNNTTSDSNDNNNNNNNNNNNSNNNNSVANDSNDNNSANNISINSG